jgi:RES domain-containing protein
VTLDDAVVQRVNDLGTTPWTGETFRHTSHGRDPLSGIGARRFGGRWNPADVCSTLYLAQPLATCLDEYARMARAAGQEPEQMLDKPRQLHTVEVTELPVLDLRTEASLAYVGLNMDDITDEDWTACQTVGHAAYFLDVAGIIASSATGSGLVVAAFEGRAQPKQLTLRASQPLDAAYYRKNRAAIQP